MSVKQNGKYRTLGDNPKDRERAATCLSMAEMLTYDMVEAGYTDVEIATAMGVYMMLHIRRSIPDRELCDIWLDCMKSCQGIPE